MRKLELLARLIALSVSVAAMIFMGLVFYTEAFLQRGFLFIEPNLLIATTEFVLILVGIALSLVFFYLKDTTR